MIEDKNYITIQAFMVKDLKLKGFELLIYAIIYGFSQNKQGWFIGSLSYLMEWTLASKPTVINILKDLTKRGLIERKEEEVKGVTYPIYRVTYSGKEILPPVKNFNRGGKEILPQGGKEILPNNNIDIDKDIYIDNKYCPNSFSEEFEILWKKYPKKQGKQKAMSAFVKARGKGVSYETISQGLDNYNEWLKATKKELKYTKNGDTWFGNHCWDDEYQVDESQPRKETFAERMAKA